MNDTPTLPEIAHDEELDQQQLEAIVTQCESQPEEGAHCSTCDTPAARAITGEGSPDILYCPNPDCPDKQAA